MTTAPELLPYDDEQSDEDSLVAAQGTRTSEALRALLLPRDGTVTHGSGDKPRGLGARRVRAAASVAAAVVEDRRR